MEKYELVFNLIGDKTLTVKCDHWDIDRIIKELDTNRDYFTIKRFMIPKSSVLYIEYNEIKNNQEEVVE